MMEKEEEVAISAGDSSEAKSKVAVVVEQVASVKSQHFTRVKNKLAADQAKEITITNEASKTVEETTDKSSATDTSETTGESLDTEDTTAVEETDKTDMDTSDDGTVILEQVDAETSTPDDGESTLESDQWKKLVQQLVNSVEKTSQEINQQEIVVIVEDSLQPKVEPDSGDEAEGIQCVLENGNDERVQKKVAVNKRKRELPRSRQSDSPIEDAEVEAEFRCWYCEEVFDSNAEREDHEKMHTDSRFVLLICQQCGQSFRKSEDFEAHHRICGGEDGDGGSFNDVDGDLNSSLSGENSNSQIDSPIDTELGKYECVFCDGHYISKDNLRKHLILRHQLVHDNSSPRLYSCKYCDKDFPDRKIVLQHETVHSSKITEETGGKYPCTYCGRCCRSRTNLIEHQRMHTGEKPYSCPHCGKACTRERDVRDHIKRMHQGNIGKQLTCEYCYVIFVTRKDLTDHLKEIHNVTKLSTSGIVETNATNYICSECGKEFDHKFKHSFQEHIATHTRSHLHTCDECGKTFVRGRELRYHKARHRGEGRYVCGLCNKNFVLKWDLKKHLKTIHNIDEDGSFDKLTERKIKPSLSPDKSMVMADIMKVNPYICRICHAQFDGGKELRAHRKMHIDEEDAESEMSKEDHEQVASEGGSFPFICSFCSKGFQDKNDFVVHVGSHTKGTIGQYSKYRNIEVTPTRMTSTPAVVSPPAKRSKKILEEGEGVNFWKCCYGPCRKDLKIYNVKEEFEAHIKMHMDEHTNICEHCGRCFSRTRDLAYHKKIQGIRPCKYLPVAEEEEGKDPNEIANPLSGLSLSKKLALLQPSGAQVLGVPPSLKLHTCGCGQKVQGFKEFQIHVLTHKSSDGCEFCQYCGESFPDHDTLTGEHLKETCETPCKYAPFALNGEDPDDMYGEDGEPGEEQNGSNGDAGDGSSYSMMLAHPVKLAINNKIVGNVIAVSDDNLSTPQRQTRSSLQDKPFACRFCGKAFRARSYVREHETVHTKEANFECEVCDRRFTRARELRAHMKKHNGNEPWACDTCPKRFLNQVQYRLHMERSHETEMEADEDADDMENVNIVDNNKASASTNSHGSQSFKCGLCSKHFTHLDHFKAHMEIVHDVEVSVLNPGELPDELQNSGDTLDDDMDESKEEVELGPEVIQAVTAIDVVEDMDES